MRLYRNWLLGGVCLRAVASAPCLAKPCALPRFEDVFAVRAKGGSFGVPSPALAQPVVERFAGVLNG